MEGVGQVEDAAFDRHLAAEGPEAGVAQIGVLDAAGAASGKRSGSRAAEAVGGAAEVVDQRVIPVAEELADNADARAAEVLAVVEPLRGGSCRVGTVIVAADIPVHTGR